MKRFGWESKKGGKRTEFSQYCMCSRRTDRAPMAHDPCKGLMSKFLKNSITHGPGAYAPGSCFPCFQVIKAPFPLHFDT